MSTPVHPIFTAGSLEALATAQGRIALLADGDAPKSADQNAEADGKAARNGVARVLHALSMAALSRWSRSASPIRCANAKPRRAIAVFPA